MRKILYYNTFSTIGGGEISLLSLIKGLKEQFEIIVACPPGDFPEVLNNVGTKVITVKTDMLKPIRMRWHNRYWGLNLFTCLYDVFLFMKNLFRLNKVIKSTKPDIIHTNTLESIGLIIFPSVIHKIPIFWHVRILLQYKSITIRFYVKLISLFVNRVIAISRAVEQTLIKAGMKPDKISVVYNPIDTELFRPQNRATCRKKFGLSKNSIIIGSLGRLTPDKGFEILIRAMASVVRQYPDTCLLIAGDEWTKGYREKLSRTAEQAGVLSNLILINRQKKIAELISALDVVVLASPKKEGFGRVLAEAMACGVPVIGAKVGGVPEIITHGENGLLVEPGDPRALSEAILKLLKNRALSAELVRNGRKVVQTKFSVEKHINRIKLIYEDGLRMK